MKLSKNEVQDEKDFPHRHMNTPLCLKTPLQLLRAVDDKVTDRFEKSLGASSSRQQTKLHFWSPQLSFLGGCCNAVVGCQGKLHVELIFQSKFFENIFY